MMIGTAGAGRSALCTSDAASIAVFGHDLCRDLMGKVSFAGFFFLMAARAEDAIAHAPQEVDR